MQSQLLNPIDIPPTSLQNAQNNISIATTLASHCLNTDMITAVIYLCQKYHLSFLDYIDSGFFGSVFFVQQHGFIYALKIALSRPNAVHSPVEPLLNLLTSTPTLGSDPSNSPNLSSVPHPCLPLCYLAIHETISPQQVTLEPSPQHLDTSPTSSSIPPSFTFHNENPLHISASLLSYVPGVDIGNFTEFQLKREYITYKQQHSQLNTHLQHSNLPTPSVPTMLTQSEYLSKHYNNIHFLTTQTIQIITAQLLLVTAYCHTHGAIVHRDIKPTNVLLSPLFPNSASNDINRTITHLLNASTAPLNVIPAITDAPQIVDPHSLLPSTTATLHQRIQQQTLQHTLHYFSATSSPPGVSLPDETNLETPTHPFPLIQLLDFGLSHIPFNSDMFAEFLQTTPKSSFSFLSAELSDAQLFQDINAYQTDFAYDYSLDYFAIALTVLELLLGYIPGSKTDHTQVKKIIQQEMRQQQQQQQQQEQEQEQEQQLIESNLNYTDNLVILQKPSLTQREIYKFIRKRGMRGILSEYDDYIASLEQKSVFKRTFTPEMIQTFDLLLSVTPSNRALAFDTKWIQDSIPTIVNGWKCYIHDTHHKSQLSTLLPPTSPNTITNIQKEALFPQFNFQTSKFFINMTPPRQPAHPLMNLIRVVLFYQYTLAKHTIQPPESQNMSNSLQFALFSPFYLSFLSNQSNRTDVLTLTTSISFQAQCAQLLPQIVSFLRHFPHNDSLCECEVAQRYDKP